MKRLSIRFKITFWFTMALILVMLLTYFITFSVSNRIIQKTIRDSLIETVEHNVDEIEFYHSIEEMDLSGDVDHFLEYGNGYLEVDDDFLDAVQQRLYRPVSCGRSLSVWGKSDCRRSGSVFFCGFTGTADNNRRNALLPL